MHITALVEPGHRVLGIGIDTADVGASERSLRAFGGAYVRRVCAEAEAASLPVDLTERARAIATLWAAKEAATKTLAPARHDQWPWPSVEIDLTTGLVRLHGRAAQLAREAGIDRLHVVPAQPDGVTSTAPGSHPVGPVGDNGTRQPAAGRVTVVALATADVRTRRTPPRAPHTEKDAMSTVTDQIRQILADHAGLPDGAASTIATDADLFDAGMTSHASVNVMMAIEDELDVEFPDDMLQRSTFQTIDSIESAVNQLQE